MTDVPENKQNEPQSEKKSWVEAEKYIQLGIMLPVAVVVGYFLGSFLDDKFGTTWIKLAGLFVGIIAGFVQLARIAMSDDAKK